MYICARMCAHYMGLQRYEKYSTCANIKSKY